MRRLWVHMRELWPRWTLLPGLPFLAWGLFWIARGVVRWDYLLMMTVLPLLAYFSRRTKRFFAGMLPFFLVGLIYDASRFVKNWGLSESRVHTCDLRELEAAIFGLPHGGGRVTLPDYFHAHSQPWLDLLCAIPYATYFLVVLAYAVYAALRRLPVLPRFGWAFLVMTVAGLVTFHVYPAAPPWYVRAYGCTVDLAAANSAADALLRVDAMTGVPFFRGLYSRAAVVFGAMPSLHVAYPLLTLLASWRTHGWPLRGAIFAFYLLMCFAAVYLDHHWVLDIVAGSFYAVGAWMLMGRVVAGAV